MAENQSFRSSLGGFNREDVVQYLEFIKSKHQNELASLHTEIARLKALLDTAAPVQMDNPALLEEIAQLKEANAALEQAAAKPECGPELEALRREVQQLRSEKVLLEQKNALLELKVQEAGKVDSQAHQELEVYRRAERYEREARERADRICQDSQQQAQLLYQQTRSAFTQATAKMDGVYAQLGDTTTQLLQQLEQLKSNISSSQQALSDAASLLNHFSQDV